MSKTLAEKITESVAENVHHAGTLGNGVLQRIEELIGSSFNKTLETGCGKSTIFFSAASKSHLCFALDDSNEENSSVSFAQNNELFNKESCRFIFGPSQKTIPYFDFNADEFDVVFLDGPHGYPFVELEYYFVYPHIKKGGYLILDDVNIPSIGRFADLLFEDEMYELVETVVTTAIFRRTSASVFDPTCDGWFMQRYNRRRVSPKREIYIKEENVRDYFTSLNLDYWLHEGKLHAQLGKPAQGPVQWANRIQKKRRFWFF